MCAKVKLLRVACHLTSALVCVFSLLDYPCAKGRTARSFQKLLPLRRAIMNRAQTQERREKVDMKSVAKNELVLLPNILVEKTNLRQRLAKS